MNTIRPEMAQHPLAKAAREVNDYAETHGLNETCERYNLATEDVRYIAEQRAYRVLWAIKGINLNLKEHRILLLSAKEKEMLMSLTMAYMDGLVIGWRANELNNGREQQ